MNAGTTWRRFVSESEPNYQDRENIRSLKSGNSWKVKRLSVSQGKSYNIHLAMLSQHLGVKGSRVGLTGVTSLSRGDTDGPRGKSVPLQAWSGPQGSRKLRFTDFVTTAQDGGKVVSLTHRPLLPPGNTPGTLEGVTPLCGEIIYLLYIYNIFPSTQQYYGIFT